VDARRSVALGGAVAVVACVAVAGTLTVSHAFALTDVAGTPVSASPIVVPVAVQAVAPLSASAAAQIGRSAESTSARTAVPSVRTSGAHDPAVTTDDSDSAVHASPHAASHVGSDDPSRAEVVPAPKPREVWGFTARAPLSGDAIGTRDRSSHATQHSTPKHTTRSSHGAHRTPAFAGRESGRYLPSSLAGSKKEGPRISPDKRGR
jgi:hypothetical protein